MKDNILIVLKGFCMGAADVVPGVSGGTMAFILGIYQRLIEAIRAFDTGLLRLVSRGQLRAAMGHVDLVFLALLGSGIAAAIFFFTRIVPLPVLLHTHPEQIYGLFFGLIAGSVVVLADEIDDWRGADLLPATAGVIAGLAIARLVPTETPETAWFVFVSGALAICAMILPGISGSFILLVLKKYAYVFDALGRLDFAVILPFALGAATGLMLFSRVLVWLLHHYYRAALLTISGILIGSLWIIWPFQERIYETVRGKARLIQSSPALPTALDGTVAMALASAVIGFGLVSVIHRLSRRHSVPR